MIVGLFIKVLPRMGTGLKDVEALILQKSASSSDHEQDLVAPVICFIPFGAESRHFRSLSSPWLGGQILDSCQAEKDS
jgi:hypothetical protein